MQDVPSVRGGLALGYELCEHLEESVRRCQECMTSGVDEEVLKEAVSKMSTSAERRERSW